MTDQLISSDWISKVKSDTSISEIKKSNRFVEMVTKKLKNPKSALRKDIEKRSKKGINHVYLYPSTFGYAKWISAKDNSKCVNDTLKLRFPGLNFNFHRDFNTGLSYQISW
jgi:hypothetical protein